MSTLTSEEMDTLDKLLPDAYLISAALAYELGIAKGRGMGDNYPETFNREMQAVGERLRAWLVSPPDGKYTMQ